MRSLINRLVYLIFVVINIYLYTFLITFNNDCSTYCTRTFVVERRGKRVRDPLEGYIKAPSTRHVLAIFHCVTFVLQENLAIPDDIY